MHVTFTWYLLSFNRILSRRHDMADKQSHSVILFLQLQNKLIFKGLREAFRLCVGLDQMSHHWRNPTSIVSSSSVVRSILGRIFRTLLRVFGVNDATCVARSSETCPWTCCWWSGLLRTVICSTADKKEEIEEKSTITIYFYKFIYKKALQEL